MGGQRQRREQATILLPTTLYAAACRASCRGRTHVHVARVYRHARRLRHVYRLATIHLPLPAQQARRMRANAAAAATPTARA